MNTVGQEILSHLRPLIGLKLSIARRAADMRIFHFDKNGPVESGSVGEYALHIQCAWRIEGLEGIITGRSDLWQPSTLSEGFDWDSWEYDDGNMQDERLALWLSGNSPSPYSQLNMTGGLVVEEVEADAYGGAAFTLSGGYRLVIFPAGADGEDWRLLQCHRKGSHFVVEGGKIQG